MAGAKETPRQKMIGMMYLVLTALLALNISKEILNGFVKVEKGLRQTNLTVQGKSRETMLEFEAKYLQDQQKVKPYYDAAQDVETQADELYDHITQLKANILAVASGKREVVEAGGDISEFIAQDKLTRRDTVLSIAHFEKKDEYQEITSYLVGGEPSSPKTGAFTASELKDKLELFRNNLKGVTFNDFVGNKFEVSPGLKASFDQTFKYEKEMEDGKEVLWEAANFFDVPLAAVIPILSKLQIDVANAKSNMMSELIAGIEGKSYKFTNLMPLVVPESNYILRGDSFRADVLLAAFDATNSPNIYVDNREFNGRDSSLLPYTDKDPLRIEGGLGKIRIATRGMSLGERNYKGLIRFQGPDGNVGDYPFYTPEFTVAEPALVVSPTKMNVFYRGVPNPVEISVPGVSSDKLDVRITGGHKIKPDGETFIVDPGAGAEASIEVTAILPDGTKKSLPGREFRVKRIPDPSPRFAGKGPSDKTITKVLLENAPSVGALMENFDFDVVVKVKRFNVTVTKGGTFVEQSSSSNLVTSNMKELFRSVGRGSVVYIEDIVVSMPDNTERALPTMKLKVI
jgi:gliding motility-associated protein GldM